MLWFISVNESYENMNLSESTDNEDLFLRENVYVYIYISIYVFLMFLKIGFIVSCSVDKTGYRQINMKPDYPAENWAIGNITFILVQDLQDY